ncbi:hypothetical protein TNIN_370391 [Trichonephila inaurata madagascariensis]|uniref:Uncharacterized protein n=1 Tax=Trichonephila inaurata madagascariensis TaxID=2747483 RepID=A0A8X6ITY3_9ARAC|nr:hypothetical protein TNIN_370391 [Trichonephila inaurata madagascariensis]
MNDSESFEQCRPGRESSLSPHDQKSNLLDARKCTVVSSERHDMISHECLSFRNRRRRCVSRDPRLRMTFANELRPGWRDRIRNIRTQISNWFARLRRA